MNVQHKDPVVAVAPSAQPAAVVLDATRLRLTAIGGILGAIPPVA